MFGFLTKLLLVARSRPRSRASLEGENLVLRQQVTVLSRKSPSRVLLGNIDRPTRKSCSSMNSLEILVKQG
jgi:hypothetical protein